MEKYIYDEKTGISYTLQGDYYLPDIALSTEEQQPVGLWGQRHARYLKQHHPVFFCQPRKVSHDRRAQRKCRPPDDKLHRIYSVAQGGREIICQQHPKAEYQNIHHCAFCCPAVNGNQRAHQDPDRHLGKDFPPIRCENVQQSRSGSDSKPQT